MKNIIENNTTALSMDPKPFIVTSAVSGITYKSDALARERQERRKRQRIAERQNVDRKAKRKAQRHARRVTREGRRR